MKHVVSLELAKKLVDAGIVVESCFWHHKELNGKWNVVSYGERPCPWRNGEEDDDIPAPLPCELMEVLPDSRGHDWWSVYKMTGGKYCCTIPENIIGPSREEYPIKIADKPADALAQMLLWLKEKELI